MPLRLSLLPRQRALIGTSWVQNGGSRTVSLLIETESKLVREKYVIDPEQVDTIGKELQYAVLQMYVADRAADHVDAFRNAARRAKADRPQAADLVCDIESLVETGELYRALKQSLALVLSESFGRSPTENRTSHLPHAEVAAAGGPRSTRDRGASFEAPLRGAPQDEEDRPAARTRKVELGPDERLVIGRAIVRNGDTRARLLVDADATFIQGKHLIEAAEADTACKRLYVVVQDMCMSDEPDRLTERFNAAAHDVIARLPVAVPMIVGIAERVEARRFLQALAAGRDLIAAEAAHARGAVLLRPLPHASAARFVPVIGSTAAAA